ncbi:BrnA antitoxin family protein [Synechocystis sp. CACIAM 05]|uniref:BrnA antitoxin family protein n=1 Tax=Synechocystis sp. CACIAM 05 TaxID=1933929 RepID=UPI00138E5CEB|nr:CopG family antitoxin [Synechocystis sp. CACIAM 05]QHV01658.1 CopG family transcriptional regulator [Synechocystis sp. CACIAM 05]
MNKPLPKMNSDQEAEDLLEQDLTDYLVPENFTKTTFEFAPKDKSITLRLSLELLTAVKNAARAQGMNYQKYIREVLEQSVLRP